MRWRPLILAVAVTGVSLAHYLTPVGPHDAHAHHAHHALYRWCYHLPIILASFWFGLRGGVFTALAVTILYVPHVVLQWAGGTTEQWLEVVLYNVVGWVTGLLSWRQKADRDRSQRAAEELDRAYAELKERTSVLLETEEQLRQADRLTALGELSAGLAHEVKTPLASIRGAVEILSGDSLSRSEKQEFSGILLREADRLNRVVNQFLEFARPTRSPVSEADLDEAVREILQLVKAQCETLGVEVRTNSPEPSPPVLIDPEQLRQVILNLVVNALQAMRAGGRLELRTELSPPHVRLTVTDTGHGIPEALQPRIFDPFVTGRPKGTGLGLSIVRRILENHRASIEVRSRMGDGTEIEVRLPAEEPSHDRRQANPARRR